MLESCGTLTLLVLGWWFDIHWHSWSDGLRTFVLSRWITCGGPGGRGGVGPHAPRSLLRPGRVVVTPAALPSLSPPLYIQRNLLCWAEFWIIPLLVCLSGWFLFIMFRASTRSYDVKSNIFWKPYFFRPTATKRNHWVQSIVGTSVSLSPFYVFYLP